jgi:hypothetical protein
MAKNKNKTLKQKKSSKYSFPKHYYQGISKKDKAKQLKELENSRNLYKKGIFKSRSQKLSFNSKKSSHIIEFEDKYGVKINNLKAVEKVTGVSKTAQKQIMKKGMGAFYSSGSRPNQSAQSWALARLASVLLKHNAYRVDRHVLIEHNCDNIKQPPKNKRGGGKDKKYKSNKTIDCCKITDANEKKLKKCNRKSKSNTSPSQTKEFVLPRRFSRKACTNPRGFTMKSSCAPFINC